MVMKSVALTYTAIGLLFKSGAICLHVPTNSVSSTAIPNLEHATYSTISIPKC